MTPDTPSLHKTCPKCGAERHSESQDVTFFVCGTERFRGDVIREGSACTIAQLRQQLAECQQSRDSYKFAYDQAIDAADSVFQVGSTKEPPLLPDFLRLGECKFKGVVKLAKAYIALQQQLAAVTRERDELKADIADHEIINGTMWRQAMETINGNRTYIQERHVCALVARVEELQEQLTALTKEPTP